MNMRAGDIFECKANGNFPILNNQYPTKIDRLDGEKGDLWIYLYRNEHGYNIFYSITNNLYYLWHYTCIEDQFFPTYFTKIYDQT